MQQKGNNKPKAASNGVSNIFRLKPSRFRPQLGRSPILAANYSTQDGLTINYGKVAV